ncbi:hypothetical protein C1H46_009327 [Malus baccata]|uniref:HMA domain-containing protein n=1 Tax=Malus baccata TaxID=106549 RepID=A0A540N1Y1_MALBA|nr:hypothetical protein C1H46_009327 [Malus baccata]
MGYQVQKGPVTSGSEGKVLTMKILKTKNEDSEEKKEINNLESHGGLYLAKEKRVMCLLAELEFNMHCGHCADDVKKCCSKTKGVESVEVDQVNKVVTVEGRFRHKKLLKCLRRANKIVKLLLCHSPKAATRLHIEDEFCNFAHKEDKEDEPKQVIIRALIKINLHCKCCMKDIRKACMKAEGVESVEFGHYERTAGPTAVYVRIAEVDYANPSHVQFDHHYKPFVKTAALVKGNFSIKEVLKRLWDHATKKGEVLESFEKKDERDATPKEAGETGSSQGDDDDEEYRTPKGSETSSSEGSQKDDNHFSEAGAVSSYGHHD